MAAFVLVNQCSDAELTGPVLASIAGALEVQANRDVAPYWGGNYRVRPASPDNPPADGEVVCLIVDDLPDEPGAVAYHSWEGKPDIYAARNMCSSLSSGDQSLSQALSHEICETIGDEATNLWADDRTGTEWARELCDPVESGWYVAAGNVAVSDFVLPAWFEVGSGGPYSMLQALHDGNGPPAPFTIAAGGYAVVRTSSGDEHQVTAMGAPRNLAKKRSPTSRTWRRGARL